MKIYWNRFNFYLEIFSNILCVIVPQKEMKIQIAKKKSTVSKIFILSQLITLFNWILKISWILSRISYIYNSSKNISYILFLEDLSNVPSAVIIIFKNISFFQVRNSHLLHLGIICGLVDYQQQPGLKIWKYCALNLAK